MVLMVEGISINSVQFVNRQPENYSKMLVDVWDQLSKMLGA
jgi:hypothetical protein